ncbi:uncharacterized protein K02A2.6-like [Salmo trutta]|uniref:uncharacterized protein K02A2.6-like n=1 Tax=Salmo trutta TaxID=8032 RepID=UPI001130B63E|nr:uncharacterized protein K02A2.6-like [Salmo trutta]
MSDGEQVPLDGNADGDNQQQVQIANEDQGQVGVIMAMFGTITEFVEENEDWTEYVERLGHFFLANGIIDEAKQRSILLSVCGAKTYKLMRNLATPRRPGEIPFGDLVALVQTHHNPKPSVIVQRFKFNCHFRKTGQSVANFVAELRELSEHCEFGAMLEDMLRDRLVCGINEDSIQRRLLGEATLTFKRALELSQGMEMAASNVKNIQKANSESCAVHQVTKEAAGKRGKAVECFRCGGTHYGNNCKFMETVCHNCNKKGHLAKKCRGPRSKPEGGRTGLGKFTAPKPQSAAHHLESTEEEDEHCSYNMFNVREPRAEPIYATVEVDGKQMRMEVDTGASASVISEETYKQKWGSRQVSALTPAGIRLRTYTGETIPLLGALEVNIAYNSQEARARLLVVKGNGPSLLGRDWLNKIQLSWGEIKHTRVTEDVIQKYPEIFKEELGTLQGTTVKLFVDPQAEPRFFKPRTVPYAMKKKVEDELERLQEANVITPVQFSRWAAPIVPVLKSDGTVRICGDYKLTINRASKLDAYPLPRVEDLFATLAGGKTFSKLDMSHAYQQLLLDEDSKEYVTVNTHKGLFRYNRLVFGVASSPAIFQRTMDNLLQGIPHVAVYLDDILVTGETEEEHLHHLDQVLKRFSEAGLRLKRSKCTFQAQSVTYLGHKITAQGLCPVEDKVRAIKDAPNPKNGSELRSFLGMVNYYGKFLPELSTVLAPLYQLLHKDCKWKWGPAQEKAFKEVKALLQSAQLLVHFDQDKEIILSCDASPYGVGAVLSHQMEDGSERPIGFASRTLTSAEKGYSQLDKEGLAIVFAVKRFHQYLYGSHFTICTDHKPLMSLFSESRCIPPMASARLQRWALTLSAYQYTIVYRAGKDNANADALSRLPLPEMPATTVVPPETIFLMERLSNSPVNANQIKQWTDRDPILSQVKRFLMQGWPPVIEDDGLGPYAKRKTELSVQDGCILWGSRVVVPPPGRAQVMDEVHEAHPGASRMKSLARSYIWWPNMDQEVEDKVKSCSECQINQKMAPPAPLHLWEWPDHPWSRLHIDFAGPFMGHMFLVMVDAHSKWLEAHIMSNITATTTIEKLRQVFSTHGLPDSLVSDNATTFTCDLFQEFMRRNGIRHVRSAPFHPASNGLAERAVQTLKEGLKRMTGGTITTKLSRFLFQYRITPQTTTGQAPAVMLMGRRPKAHLDLLRPNIRARVERKQEKQKERHDHHARERQLKPNDTVYIRNFTSSQRWLPGIILSQSGPVSFVVKLTDGRVMRRHQDHGAAVGSSPSRKGPDADAESSSPIKKKKVLKEMEKTDEEQDRVTAVKDTGWKEAAQQREEWKGGEGDGNVRR